MPRSRTLMTAQVLLVVLGGFSFSSQYAISQQAPFTLTSNRFEDYFNALATTQGAGTSRSEAALESLAESIGSMTPAEIAAGVSTIDRQIDNTAEDQNPWAKPQAAFLLKIIAGRSDGPDLLTSQMNRLASMVNDTAHVLSGPAVLVLQMIGYRKPEVVIPILEEALKDPNVNNKTGPGPGIAVILLRLGPHDAGVAEHVAQYMRRPDLTEYQLLDTIIGINNSRPIPDTLAAELVRCLDSPNERVKIRALVGISRSSPRGKDDARARIQNMASDPNETAHVRRIAAEALEREVTEDPETNK